MKERKPFRDWDVAYAVQTVKDFEDCRLEAYQCSAGVWTIGYGHTFGVKKGDTITSDQARQILFDDLEYFKEAVERFVFSPVSKGEFAALMSFIFNLGEWNFKRSTLLAKLNRSDYEGAADQFLRWNKVGQKVIKGLVRRREAERRLFLEG